MNTQVLEAMCHYFDNVRENVEQYISEEGITLTCKDRGTLSNIAELLSFYDCVVRYNSLEAQSIIVEV